MKQRKIKQKETIYQEPFGVPVTPPPNNMGVQITKSHKEAFTKNFNNRESEVLSMNLKQAYDIFIMSREEFCLSSTIQAYKNTLRYFLEYMQLKKEIPLEELDINEITRADLQAYTIYLRNRPKFQNHPYHEIDTSGLTKKSIHTYQTDLKAFFRYLYDEEFLEKDLMKKYRMVSPEKRQLIPLTIADVKTLDAINDMNTARGCRNLCVLHLMLDAGLRLSEVIELKILDVDFERNYIFVRSGKGSKDRIIPLVPRLKRILYRYVVLHRPDRLSHDYFLSTIKTHEPLTKDCITSLFSRMHKHLSISRFYPHLLRHTFATAYVLGGGDLESLRIYMGHSDISTTQNYLHLAAEIQCVVDVYKLDSHMFRRLLD